MSLSKKDLLKLIDNIAVHWGSIRNKQSKDGAGRRLWPSQTPKNDGDSKGLLDQGEKLPKNDKKDEDEPSDSCNINIQANNQGSARQKTLVTVQVQPNDTEDEVKAKLRSAAQSGGLI
ncbi:hypothetical protein A1O7_07457 [Cladophialophora yegresii CBS 114405]|uniref:Uncharacterized protein n=1 Tax=Cladophialophora yegresii CBS 114405 TaxID=1182544 RepID=W9VNK2_9EURO|nr:uncharacterized protein A1O7_07457 [Cladophialophora yegresii CBS 114405]EXJ57113.1 hypothetical protein A1O7_07457 [Cladophialophora yegresii CBS 114405]